MRSALPDMRTKQMSDNYSEDLRNMRVSERMRLMLGDPTNFSDQEELRNIQIEKCETQRTLFYFNGKGYRIDPQKLQKMFMLTDIEMNKLCMGVCIGYKATNTAYKEIFEELDKLPVS